MPFSDFRLAGDQPDSQAFNADSKTLHLPDGLTPDQRAFLSAYVETATLTHAAEVSRVDRSRHYDWVRDPVYARAFTRAKEAAADKLEGEARRRAVEGVERAVGWHKGQPGGYERVYSDTLLITLLKAWIPDRFKEKVEHTFSGRISDMTPEQCKAMEAELLAMHPQLALEGKTVVDGTAEVIEDKTDDQQV